MFQEDLSEFFDEGSGFAVPAILRAHDNRFAPRRLSVIFDEAYYDTALGEYNLDTTQPRAHAPFADIAMATWKDTLEVNGKRYEVTREPQPDGTGLGTLALVPPRK